MGNSIFTIDLGPVEPGEQLEEEEDEVTPILNRFGAWSLTSFLHSQDFSEI